jgi:hypothetical protein
MILGVKVFARARVDLCIADSHESFCLARLAIEPLAGYGD